MIISLYLTLFSKHQINSFNVYFSIWFGAARHRNAYLRSKIRVVWRGILGLKMCIARFRHTKSDDYLILHSEILKTAFKTGFSIRNNHVNLRVLAVNSQWLFIIRKTGCKWRYLCFLVYKKTLFRFWFKGIKQVLKFT